jgi:ribosomal-protein-alanine N-acetyltransferase
MSGKQIAGDRDMTASGDVSLRFVRLEQNHAAVMAALEQACFTLPWSAAQCKAAFDQPAFMAFGCFRAHDLVAYISVYHTSDELEILNVAVTPRERRKRIGRRLLTLVLQIAHELGISKLLLEVQERNYAARNLYEKCGFMRVGARPRYYHDSGEDALLYMYELRDMSEC